MRVALIDDTNKRKSFVLAAIEQLRARHRDLELMDSIPFPVYDETYLDTLKAIQEYDQSLIVLLDLDLSLNHSLDTFVSALTPFTREEQALLSSFYQGTYWPGLLIGRECILNSRMRPLVIVIASGVTNLRQKTKWLEDVVGRTNDRRVVIQNFGSALENSELASECLSEALKGFDGLVGREDSNALVRVWHRTSGWFLADTRGKLTPECMPHTLTAGHDWKNYKSIFEEEFEIQLHQNVWRSFESVYVLHEVLKTLIGGNYCGTRESRERKYNLSCGAAYVLLLLAEKAVVEDPANRRWHASVEGFDRFPYFPSPLLAVQSPEVARRGALGIYSLFTTLLVPEEKHRNAAVDGVSVLEEGKTLRVLFTRGWNHQSFAEWADSVHGNSQCLGEVWFSNEDPSRLRDCMGAVWRALTCSDLGFGAPGSIWMEMNKLTFHSAAGKKVKAGDQ